MDKTVKLEDYSDTFIISYDGELHSVNSNTFANSLIPFAKAIEEINKVIDPNSQIEVRIEAIDKGSFKPTIKICKKILNAALPFLPAKNDTVPVFLAALAIYYAQSDKEKIIIKDTEVIIQSKDSRIIIQKNVYEQATELADNENIKKNLALGFEALENDSSVSGLTMQKSLSDTVYPFSSTREEFKYFIDLGEPKIDKEDRIQTNEETTLQLIKIILEKGKRKWEFAWRGIKISAPVTDSAFWAKMEAGEISIKQGDRIHATLKITQVLDKLTKAYFNESYEVVEVKQYLSQPSQSSISFQD